MKSVSLDYVLGCDYLEGSKKYFKERYSSSPRKGTLALKVISVLEGGGGGKSSGLRTYFWR